MESRYVSVVNDEILYIYKKRFVNNAGNFTLFTIIICTVVCILERELNFK